MTPGAGKLQQARLRSMSVGVWRLSVDSSNYCKSAGHEKAQCLEDYH